MASQPTPATYAEFVAREIENGRELPADVAVSSGDESEWESEWESERESEKEDDVKESDQENTSSDLNFSRTNIVPASKESALTTQLHPAILTNDVLDESDVRQDLVSELKDDEKESLLQLRSVQRPYMGKGKSDVATKPEERPADVNETEDKRYCAADTGEDRSAMKGCFSRAREQLRAGAGDKKSRIVHNGAHKRANPGPNPATERGDWIPPVIESVW